MSYYMLTRLKRFISQRIYKLCNKLFYLPIFSVLCMRHLLYLIFRCDFDVTKSLKNLEKLNTANVEGREPKKNYPASEFAVAKRERSTRISQTLTSWPCILRLERLECFICFSFSLAYTSPGDFVTSLEKTYLSR